MHSRMALVTLLAGLVAVGAGCQHSRTTRGCSPNCHHTGLDEHAAGRQGLHAARCALKRCGKVSCHFREGFEQAYIDIAQGSDGTPPGVPPERYWNTGYRNPEGHLRAEEWMAGYHAGVQGAMAEGRAQVNFIPTSVSLP